MCLAVAIDVEFHESTLRTVTETLSPVADLGQDAKPEENGNSEEDKFDKLELRNRWVK